MAKPKPVPLRVVATEQIAPVLRRIVFGGDGAAELAARDQGFTDRYAKLVFLPEGFDYPERIDLDQIKADMPQEAWPTLRTYTLRKLTDKEVWIDFVVHGAEGFAGPWAEQAQPGDILHVRGPSGAYRPDPDVDVHLMAGDEAAIPAIAAALEVLEPGARAAVFIEVDGVDDEMKLETAADAEITWLHRGDRAPGFTDLLDEAVRAWEWPAGDVQAFVHGEAGLLKTVRPYLLKDRELPRSNVSISGYWRRGDTEERFRVWKTQQTEAIIRPDKR